MMTHQVGLHRKGQGSRLLKASLLQENNIVNFKNKNDMAAITAADVNKLRQQTGAGMMDCKNALVEADGDIEAAKEILRKKGQKIANNRADRENKEGYVIAKVNADNDRASMIMLNCETDFVGKSNDFVSMANQIIDIAVANNPKDVDELKSMMLDGHTIEDQVTNLMGKTGEKITLSYLNQINAARVFAYNHHGNRLATIMGVNKKDVQNLDNIGKEICMQIAAMNPVALDKEGVDPAIIEKEIEIGKEQARQEGKPEEMLEKIALGKLNKFYKESTLLNQEFLRDPKKTIRQYLEEADKELTITEFKRLILE